MILRPLKGLLAMIWIAGSSQAAEWSIEPSVSARASVTDNLNLTPGTSESIWWTNLAPQAKFARRTEASEISGVARLSFNRYPGNPQFDATDQLLSGVAQFGEERTRWGLAGSFTRDSTLQSEQATTGIAQARRQRSLSSLSPSWRFQLSERSSLFANYQYSMAEYEAGAGLRDYSDQQASLGYQYLLTETTALSMNAGGGRFETENADVRSDTLRLDAGLTHSLSEQLSVGFNAGYRRTDTRLSALLCPVVPAQLCEFLNIPLEQFVSRTRDTGLSLSATADFQWELTTLGVNLGRNTNPSGSGLVVVTDRAGGSLRHNFSEKFSGSLSADGLRSRYVAGPAGESRFYNMDASAQYKPGERWTLSAGFSQSRQYSKDLPDYARGSTLYLNIVYEFLPMALSR
jgi:hypothetical protein